MLAPTSNEHEQDSLEVVDVFLCSMFFTFFALQNSKDVKNYPEIIFLFIKSFENLFFIFNFFFSC